MQNNQECDHLSYFLRHTPLANFLHTSDLLRLLGICRQIHDIRLTDCNLRVLDISGFTGRHLSDFGRRSAKTDALLLPATLEKLVCKGCANLTAIDIILPDTLQHLELANCDSLEYIRTPLPSALRVFKCIDCEDLRDHPNPLPDGLLIYELQSHACIEIDRLPEPLPSALVELTCTGLSGEGQIVNLPSTWPTNLRVLNLSYTSLWDELINLPVSLESLNLCMCDCMPQLPSNLRELTNLRILDLTGCDEIKHICDDVLPENLEHLICNEMYQLVSFPRRLPASLHTFESVTCPVLNKYPEELPQTLRFFVFSDDTQQPIPQPPLALPPFPDGTTVIDRKRP
jgi:Leucine-rich repeat (LRR) protein